jgi:hypothetical protein
MNMTIDATPTSGVSPDLIALVMKYGSQGIVGAGHTVGGIASNRGLIAETEEEFRALWRRFRPEDGSAIAVSMAHP